MALEHLHYIGDGVQLTVGDAQNHGGKGSFGGMKLYKKRDGGEKFQIYGGAMWCKSSMLVVQENLDILVHRQYGAKVGGAGKSINILVQEYGARIVWCRFQQYGGRGK